MDVDGTMPTDHFYGNPFGGQFFTNEPAAVPLDSDDATYKEESPRRMLTSLERNPLITDFRPGESVGMKRHMEYESLGNDDSVNLTKVMMVALGSAIFMIGLRGMMR